MKLSQDQIENIIELHSAGISDREIAKYCHHGREQVAKYTDSKYLSQLFLVSNAEIKILENLYKRALYFHKFLSTSLIAFVLAIAIILNFI